MRNQSNANQFRLEVHFHANQSHFHKNSFARRLVLKQRHRATLSLADKYQFHKRLEQCYGTTAFGLLTEPLWKGEYLGQMIKRYATKHSSMLSWRVDRNSFLCACVLTATFYIEGLQVQRNVATRDEHWCSLTFNNTSWSWRNSQIFGKCIYSSWCLVLGLLGSNTEGEKCFKLYSLPPPPYWDCVISETV